MSGFRQFDALERAVLPPAPVHLAIGFFDGVHRGHQAVIRAAIEAARAAGGVAGILTFEPHPSVVLRPESAARLIFPPAVKRSLLRATGIDFLIEHPFTPGFAATSARDFVASLRHALPGLQAVYVGENFRFGHGREGDLAVLRTAAAEVGFAVRGAARITDDGMAISSSRLRELIGSGAMEQASALLGYTYFSEGIVTPGKRLGRKLGFPTLNIACAPGLRPAFGVYAVTVEGLDGSPQPAVANFGLRPTVESGATEPRLEAHVLGSTGLTYGDQVRVRWLRFLRAERKFGSEEELKAQIEVDREGARAALMELSPQNFPKSA